MKDSYILLHLPLVPGSRAAQELADAGWKNLSGAVYFLSANESRVTANLRLFSDNYPIPGKQQAIQLIPVPGQPEKN